MTRRAARTAAGALAVLSLGSCGWFGIGGPSEEAEAACLRAVAAETGSAQVVVIETRKVAAGTMVTVGTGPDQAPRTCIGTVTAPADAAS